MGRASARPTVVPNHPQPERAARIMAKFTSKTPYLTLQDAVSDKDVEAAAKKGEKAPTGVWAEFVDGKFETSDKAVIARLKKVKGVSEVKGGKSDDSDADEKSDKDAEQADDQSSGDSDN